MEPLLRRAPKRSSSSLVRPSKRQCPKQKSFHPPNVKKREARAKKNNNSLKVALKSLRQENDTNNQKIFALSEEVRILRSENQRFAAEFEKRNPKFQFKGPDGYYTAESNFLVARLVGNCAVSQNRVRDLCLILTTCSGWKESEIPKLDPRTVGRMVLRGASSAIFISGTHGKNHFTLS